MRAPFVAALLSCILLSAVSAVAEPPQAGWTNQGFAGGGRTSGSGSGQAGTSAGQIIEGDRFVVAEEYAESRCLFGGLATRYTRRDITGRIVDTWYACGTGIGVYPMPGAAAAPVPPAPSEVWGHVAVPAPVTRISPPNRGLVGFETWLWYDQPTTLNLTVTLPSAWTLTIDARATYFRWHLGDHDDTTIESSVAGSRDWPAATTAFQYPCACRVTTTVTWSGTYSVTLADGTTRTVDLGSRDFSGPPLEYPVDERQAVITANH